MARRKKAPVRIIHPDAKYGSIALTKFINRVMKRGKKAVAEGIVYGAFEILTKMTKLNPIEVFEQAVSNASPAMEVRSRRIGGATYQVPVEVRDQRALALAMRWIINAALKRGEKSMKEKLAAEFNDAYNNRGAAIKEKERLKAMADSNRAFAHYKI